MKAKLLKDNFFIIFLIFFSFTICCVYSNTGYAQSKDLYAFKTQKQQTEFDGLLKDLRCMVCQNQDLNDSHSTFSDGVREDIHTWILEGKSQQEILEILTERYGDYILFKPPVQEKTYVLWVAPFVLFILAIAGLVILVLHRKKNVSKKRTKPTEL